MKQVIFICETCKNRNKDRHSEGRPLVIDEYESFTNAWKHLYNSYNDRDDCPHEMRAEVRE